MDNEQLKQKRIKVLNDTISFFNSENRCTEDNTRCTYYLAGKSGCAIGRLIEDKQLCVTLDGMISPGVSNERVFNMLPKKIKELGIDFLYELQKLHDYSYNWCIEGLSDNGKDSVDEIKIRFNLN